MFSLPLITCHFDGCSLAIWLTLITQLASLPQCAGCQRQAWGKALGDLLGPAGRACWLHGGRVCNVPGCRSQPRGRVAEADGLGAAGLRCTAHLKGQPLRQGPKRSRQPSEPLPESAERCNCATKGWRCKRPRVENKKYCEHHEAVNQKRLQRLREAYTPLQPPNKKHLEPVPDPAARCKYGMKRWRCKRQRAGGKNYCEHHEVLYQKRLHKVRLQEIAEKKGLEPGHRGQSGQIMDKATSSAPTNFEPR